MRHPAAGPKRAQAFLQRIATGERQHGVDAVWGKAARLIVDIDAFAVNNVVRAHLPYQFYPFVARCGRKHLGAAELSELHRKRPNPSRGAVNDDGLALFQTQRIVNALQRGQARDRDRAGMPQIQPLGDRRDLVGRHRDIFGVEAALRILPIVAIDFVAALQPPHPRADFCDDAGAVIAENQRKMRLAGSEISFPDIGVPSADAGGIDGDQNLPGIDFRDRQSVSGDHLGSTEAVDGGSEHGARHMHRVMAGARKIAGAIEHDRDLTVGRSASWTWLPAAALTLVNFSGSNARRRLEAMPTAIGNAPLAAPSGRCASCGLYPAVQYPED